jgi:hypothetical protein
MHTQTHALSLSLFHARARTHTHTHLVEDNTAGDNGVTDCNKPACPEREVQGLGQLGRVQGLSQVVRVHTHTHTRTHTHTHTHTHTTAHAPDVGKIIIDKVLLKKALLHVVVLDFSVGFTDREEEGWGAWERENERERERWLA